jgi:hypothetical protein
VPLGCVAVWRDGLGELKAGHSVSCRFDRASTSCGVSMRLIGPSTSSWTKQKGPCLATVADYRVGRPRVWHDEVGHHPAIVRPRPRAVGVKLGPPRPADQVGDGS